MENQDLLDIIKIQSGIIEKLTQRVLDKLPPTPERADLKELLELLKEKSKSI